LREERQRLQDRLLRMQPPRTHPISTLRKTVMKYISNTSTSRRPLTTAQQMARSRKKSVLISILCYWFIVGIVFVAYARYFDGPRMPFDLTIPQFHQLAEMLAVAGLIAALFVFRWVRLDQIERSLEAPLIHTVFGVANISMYLIETRAPGERWHTFLGNLAFRIGCLFATLIGAYVAFIAFVE
jgi:uncharacterized membrane protein